ncbi:uncharacterized protein LOC136010395 [Lathamus discolor]|uniref:uncharacterized protein LOC136010395 n=1 Tax=Lathamus discolor TaxID=678569 RepID=UPI0032B7B481
MERPLLRDTRPTSAEGRRLHRACRSAWRAPAGARPPGHGKTQRQGRLLPAGPDSAGTTRSASSNTQETHEGIPEEEGGNRYFPAGLLRGKRERRVRPTPAPRPREPTAAAGTREDSRCRQRNAARSENGRARKIPHPWPMREGPTPARLANRAAQLRPCPRAGTNTTGRRTTRPEEGQKTVRGRKPVSGLLQTPAAHAHVRIRAGRTVAGSIFIWPQLCISKLHQQTGAALTFLEVTLQ